MTPFLKLVADDLYRKLGGQFQDTCIIFPNKRASLFFTEYLWSNSNGETMWTPEYTSISELFASLSDYTTGDSIFLVLKLWEVYREKMQPTKPLDQLYALMETMLSDFQDIDNNMVDPSKLFLNIAELKEMTDFSFLEDEQREAIELFFGKFFTERNANTPLKSQFKTLWNKMTELYEAYQAALLDTEEEPMLYEGMLKRKVVEALTGKDEDARMRVDARLSAKTYVAVGFNVLNKTEMELFRYIKQNRDAKFYWDYDIAYTKPFIHNEERGTKRPEGVLSKYEAGQFILENIRLLGNEFEGQDLFNNMRQPKKISFIQSPTENAQTRYINEWMKVHVGNDKPLKESAVILCNENLLQPVLYSIGETDTINVTMGYPLTETPAYSLVQALLELQMHGHTMSGAWRYKNVAAVLKHSFIQKLAGKDCNEKLHELKKKNVVFPGPERFADNEIMQRIFTHVTGKNLTSYLADIISMVGHSYQTHKSDEDNSLQIYKECIFTAYTIINRIHTLQEGHTALAVSDETQARLILQLMSQASIPFHGEPAIGLQVMGLLETRNLDFSNIIMLSVNEGQLPKSDKRASLIPYTLRAAYGMTTIEREVSLYAYYYYRLIQRAESITLLYNSNTEGGGKGEMSRFMLQTLAEKDNLFGARQKIDLRAFSAASETKEAEAICVKKDELVMEKLHQRFNHEKILSPSAINTYMSCPLRFYFNYVAGLRPIDEVSDDVDKAMLGTIFHDAMYHLYQPYEGKPFHSTDVEALKQNEKKILQTINNAFAVNLFHYPEKDDKGCIIHYGIDRKMPKLNGTQMINRHVIKKFIINQLDADFKMAEELESQEGFWQIISMEKEYKVEFQGILLGGIIDRLDLLHALTGDRIRIVDYKTSSKNHAANSIEDLFNPEKCTKNYHIMQTLYYCKVLTDPSSEYADKTVVPALMYCAKDYGSNYSGIIKLLPNDSKSKKEITDYKAQYDEEYNAFLTQKIHEIFMPYKEGNPHGTFTQCTDKENCTYCDFLTFCQRHPDKSSNGRFS